MPLFWLLPPSILVIHCNFKLVIHLLHHLIWEVLHWIWAETLLWWVGFEIQDFDSQSRVALPVCTVYSVHCTRLSVSTVRHHMCTMTSPDKDPRQGVMGALSTSEMERWWQFKMGNTLLISSWSLYFLHVNTITIRKNMPGSPNTFWKNPCIKANQHFIHWNHIRHTDSLDW